MNAASTQSPVAVIGLGSMGYGMAVSLRRKGFAVSAFDVRPDVASKFAGEHGGKACGSVKDAAAGASIAVIVVVNADQTEDVLFGSGGLADALPKGALVMSCATMDPERARALAKAAETKGLLYLDSPISGGAQRAAQGELTVLASGSPAAMSKAEPALAAMAAKVYRLGDKAGIGASFKMVNQLLAGVHIAAASEALVFAKRLGLDIAKVYEVITASAGNSWMFENWTPDVLDGDHTPRSTVEIFTKDLGIINDMSRGTKFPTPVASAALQMFLMTAAAGMGKDDDASVARLYAQITGTELPARKA